MPTESLKCLEDFHECDGSDVLYPVPISGDLAERLDNIRELATSKNLGAPGEQTFYSRSKLRIKSLFPATTFAYSYLRGCFTKGCLTSYIGACWTKGCSDSKDAIASIVETYGRENVMFVHLPEKSELDKGPNWIGKIARRTIAEAQGKLFDGFEECHLNVDDYHVIDGHPNKQGYDKVASCVMKAVAIVTKNGASHVD
jgi:hypothetical protein